MGGGVPLLCFPVGGKAFERGDDNLCFTQPFPWLRARDFPGPASLQEAQFSVKQHLRRYLSVGAVVGLASSLGLVAASPAGATVRVTSINCTASIPALSTSTAVQNPSTSH